jgi:hypothetical protein
LQKRRLNGTRNKGGVMALRFTRKLTLVLGTAVALSAMAIMAAPAMADGPCGAGVRICVDTGDGSSLNVRPCPSRSNTCNPFVGPVIAVLRDRTPLEADSGAEPFFVCQVHGERLSGNWGPTDVWDEVVGSSDKPGGLFGYGYVFDGFVWTGSNDVIKPC